MLTNTIRAAYNSSLQQLRGLGLSRVFFENSKRNSIFGINSNKSSQLSQAAARYRSVFVRAKIGENHFNFGLVFKCKMNRNLKPEIEPKSLLLKKSYR